MTTPTPDPGTRALSYIAQEVASRKMSALIDLAVKAAQDILGWSDVQALVAIRDSCDEAIMLLETEGKAHH